MTKQINKTTTRRCTTYLFVICMFSMAASLLSSCSSDEPDNNGDGPTQSIVTESDLVGTWTLVRDNVLYSSVNPSQNDEVISYSGNSYPRYKFYKVTVSDDNVITMTETSAYGSSIGEPIHFTLDGNDLIIAGEETVAGTIEQYDNAHSWDNLRIRWNKECVLNNFDAPVLSTYML